MSNDLISREALKKKFERLVDETIPYGGVVVNDMRDLIDNAPSVDTTCPHCDSGYAQGYSDGYLKGKDERPQSEWGTWIISEIRCPNCLGYFQTDCYSMEELNKCPNCGADMRKGGAE